MVGSKPFYSLLAICYSQLASYPVFRNPAEMPLIVS